MSIKLSEDTLKQQLIGKRIKSVRLIKSLKQKELANLLATKSQTISQIENNRIYPSFNLIAMLVETLRIDAMWLLTGKGFMFSEDNRLGALSTESILKDADDTPTTPDTPDMYNLSGKPHEELQEIVKHLNERLKEASHRIGELKKELIIEKDRIIALQKTLLEQKSSYRKKS